MLNSNLLVTVLPLEELLHDISRIIEPQTLCNTHEVSELIRGRILPLGHIRDVFCNLPEPILLLAHDAYSLFSLEFRAAMSCLRYMSRSLPNSFSSSSVRSGCASKDSCSASKVFWSSSNRA